MTLKAIVVIMAFTLITSFIGTIPVAKTSPVHYTKSMSDIEIKRGAVNVSKTVFTILTKNKTATYGFQIAVETNVLLAEFNELTNAKQGTLQDASITLDKISLTSDQASAIKGADKIIIMEGDNRIEVVDWLKFNFYGVNVYYGAHCHMYLNPATAINIKTALDAAAALFAFLTVILLKTIVGAIVCGTIALTLAMLRIDYDVLYNKDHNSDNSFDMWYDVSIYEMFNSNFAVVETRRFIWLLTPPGAYIIKDKTYNPPPSPRWGSGGGGGKAQAR